MFVSLVVFSLLFAGSVVCDDWDDDWKQFEVEDEENFAMVRNQMKDF